MELNNDLIEFLKQKYPSLVYEQNGEYEVDIEKLKLELGKGSDIINEGYSLNWLGQSYSRVLRDCPTTTLIKPDNDHNQLPENINSDNVYIEGDNLEVLKHLKNAYSSKIEMIYIDPPYNTGSDGFVYNDSFNFDVETFMRLSGLDKEEAEKVLNYTKSKRNSHSAWLTFMYPRLYIARELLKEDGVIFISIDDNEQAQLKLLCDQIFGEENFIDSFVWIKKDKASGVPPRNNIIPNKEHILCYSKTDRFVSLKGQKRSLKSYKQDEDGRYWRKMPIQATGNQNNYFTITDPQTGRKYYGNWALSEETVIEMINDGKILFSEKGNPQQIVYADDLKSLTPIFSYIGKFDSEIETKKLKNDFFEGKKLFDFPKPLSLISFLIDQTTNKSDIILDFFSGSSTTADAVMQLNAEDNGNRKFIMIQLPEEIDEKNSKEAYEFCTKELKQEPIIPTIAKERIKRAAKKIKEENKDKEYIDDLDLGFKVYKTIKDDRTDVSQLVLFDVKDGIKTEVDDLEALLTTWMLHDGYDLNTKVEEFMINKYKGYRVEQTLYLLDKGFSTEDLLLLVDKLNDPKTPLINQIILNSSNFANKVLQEFHENVFSKNSKEAKIVVEDR